MSHPLSRVAPAALAALGLAASACSPSGSAAQMVSITTAPVPARYEATLPTASAALERWARQEDPERAPVSHVVDSVLTGNPAWLERLTAAAGAVADADREEWARVWAELFEFGVALPRFCSQTRVVMTGASSTLRDVIALPFVRSCVNAADADVVLRADTPSGALLAYFAPFTGATPPYDPLLAAAARDVIVNGNEYEARMAAFTLIGADDARADAALLAIHSGLDDRARADQVALAFLRSGNAEGQARAQVACQRIPRDTMCSPDRPLFDDAGDGAAKEDEPVAVPAIAARIAQLGDMGFAKVGAVNAAEVGTDAAEVILLAAGQAHWFDVETGLYPNQHDSLLRYLAALVSPDLDDVVFEEIAPAIEAESEPYELLAYSAGKLLRIEAVNYGDWYDLPAVLELINALMTKRDYASRFAVLDTGDQTAIVVAAPPAAMAKAVQAGLLAIGEAGAAEQAGKEFEEQVLRSLRD